MEKHLLLVLVMTLLGIVWFQRWVLKSNLLLESEPSLNEKVESKSQYLVIWQHKDWLKALDKILSNEAVVSLSWCLFQQTKSPGFKWGSWFLSPGSSLWKKYVHAPHSDGMPRPVLKGKCPYFNVVQWDSIIWRVEGYLEPTPKLVITTLEATTKPLKTCKPNNNKHVLVKWIFTTTYYSR